MKNVNKKVDRTKRKIYIENQGYTHSSYSLFFNSCLLLSSYSIIIQSESINDDPNEISLNCKDKLIRSLPVFFSFSWSFIALTFYLDSKFWSRLKKVGEKNCSNTIQFIEEEIYWKCQITASTFPKPHTHTQWKTVFISSVAQMLFEIKKEVNWNLLSLDY